MIRKVVLHDLAVEELAIVKQKVDDTFGIVVATRVVDDLIERMNALAVHPYLGTIDERYLPFRVLHSWHNRIYYLVTESEIRIIAIWDNRRDEKKLPEVLSSRL